MRRPCRRVSVAGIRSNIRYTRHKNTAGCTIPSRFGSVMGNLTSKRGPDTTSSPYSLRRASVLTRRRNRRTSKHSVTLRDLEVEEVSDTTPYADVCAEIKRQQLAHAAFCGYWQSFYSAPVDHVLEAGGRVLDLGCGYGFLILSLAKKFPASRFTGLDLYPMFAQDNVPSNVNFIQHDILKRLPFDDNTFDYVTMCSVLPGLSEAEWAVVMREVARVVKPKGYFEVFEADHDLKPAGPATTEIVKSVHTIFLSNRLHPHILKHLPNIFESTKEFYKPVSFRASIPVGGWGGRIGEMSYEQSVIAIRSFESIFQQNFALTPEALDQLLLQHRIQCEKHRTSMQTGRTFAQKRALKGPKQQVAPMQETSQ